MTEEQQEFIERVRQGATAKGAYDWLPDALSVIHLVPAHISSEGAAAMFLRWLEELFICQEEMPTEILTLE